MKEISDMLQKAEVSERTKDK